MGSVTKVAPPFQRAQRVCGSRGFTLVEILVVISIIAIAAGIAVVAYDSDDRGVALRESKRFAGALEHASAAAQLHSETMGVSTEGNGWRFWRRPADSGRWIAVANDDVLAPHTLPADTAVTPLTYAGRPLAADAIVPLRASGRNEPFAFAVSGRTSRVILWSDPLNRISLQAEALPP
ncbi:MAG: prepilin-type N-terminal cleavage/methylation domain-containing protein [Betaproteobacteria bacterium]